MPNSFESTSRRTRRSFIQTAGMGLGFGSLLPWQKTNVLTSLLPTLPDDEKLGVALMGMGNYATNQLAPALEVSKMCKLAGIVTGTPSKAADWLQRKPALKDHIYDYSTFDQIANDDSIDIVYVVLPNSMHAEYTIRAARAGKHVICEKPMALNEAEGKTMVEACERANRRLSIGYRLHFEPHNMEAMRLGQEQVYGKVLHMDTAFGFKIGDPTQWRLRHNLAGGGAMMDVGIYAIQAARYVTGEEPIQVTAQEFKTDPVKFAEVDETMTWQMTFPGGCVVNSTTSYALSTHRLFASAERGWFELRPAYSYGGIKGVTSEGPMEFPQINQQAAQMDDFANCIKNNLPSNADGHEGLRDMRVIDAIYRSIKTGKPISIG